MHLYDRMKRLGDATAAAAMLLALSPVILGTAAMVRLRLGPGVIFRQERPGRDGEVFEILKFRSMLDADPARGIVADEDRLTPFGRRLRATSLDELPCLLNVLRGEMSLVGPRPLRTRYLERYSPEQARRHNVLPGLTGLAQVSGRNAVGWDDRLDLGLEYLRIRGPLTDLRILCATVPVVLGRRGIGPEGAAVMEDFPGPRRVAGLVLRPRAADGPGAATSWDLIRADGGPALARAALLPDGRGGADLEIQVDGAAPDARALRRSAAQLLASEARAQGLEPHPLAAAPPAPASPRPVSAAAPLQPSPAPARQEPALAGAPSALAGRSRR